MLRDQYEYDGRLEAISAKLALEMEPELEEIDRLLDDEELYQLIRKDLAKRYPQSTATGRNSTPVEVILRLLAVKRLYDWGYRETVWHVNDSLVLRRFCRLYLEAAPDHTTLNRWALTIQPATLEAFNQRLTALATELKVTRGRKLRSDGTVVETNIHYPTDSSLLADGVRVLSRTIKRAKARIGAAGELAATTFRDRTRSAKQQARRIANEAKNRSEGAKRRLQAAYRRLVAITRATVRQAQSVVEALQAEGCHQTARLAETLQTFLPRVEQALDQTVRRVFAGEGVPAGQKIISLFEPHSAIIRRNKAGKATEFGRKVWLDEVDGGIVTRWEVLDGNPADEHQWRPAIDHHLERFGKPPDLASADRGLYSPQNERYARAQGIKRIILPKPGHKSQTRRDHECQGWFKRGRRWHAGVEGRISVLHRKHGLRRCRDKGETGVEKWVGWAVIAGNLAVLGQKLAAKAA